MASAPENQNLPLLYSGLEPLSSKNHQNFKVRVLDGAPELHKIHAVPLTIDEFIVAQRHYPIIFSLGENPVPLALMALNEGMNTFVGPDGRMLEAGYVPAYVRRYPFMLARLSPQSQELSLCFDPSANAVGEFEEGEALFDGEQPSARTKEILGFCEQFETSAQRTGQFIKELMDAKLLIDGELTITIEGQATPFVYRGFQMVSEEGLTELRGDVLRRMNQSGLLPLIYAHIFSLSLARDLFGRQVSQGWQPETPANA